MKRRILGTAGHIDHGKTTLVQALTGVDTDRLREEKERGITIDLGFAELAEGDLRLGVVDVPGHEGFVRNMLAGASGMDLVLLVVAGDEGVMPQTREHLAIVNFLRVERLVVAVTKSDLVEPDWLDLVVDDVSDFLAPTRFAGAPVVPVSARTGDGLDRLREQLRRVAGEVERDGGEDLLRLPIDRVFTIRGTGTVVTGTLWSGSVSEGDRVRLIPGGVEARVRGVQIHGDDSEAATAGARVALALSGDGIDTGSVDRGQVVVALPQWEASAMLTAELEVLPDAGWRIEHNQRLRVHLGTAEVMARCVMLDGDAIEPGGRGWVQLRLEAPLAARAGDRVVIRSYSPVTTIAGGRVAEPYPPKRRTLDGADRGALALLAASDGAARGEAAVEAALAALRLAGTDGVADALLPVAAGVGATGAEALADRLDAAGSRCGSDGRRVSPETVAAFREAMLEELERVHRDEPWRAGVGREQLRARIPDRAPRGIADRLLDDAIADGAIEVADGLVRRAGWTPVLDAERSALRERIVALLAEGGLAPPLLDEFDEEMRADPAFVAIVRGLESEGRIVQIEDGFMADAAAARAAADRVRSDLAGRSGLAPGDFREAIPVTRKHLMPILGWLDRIGVTRREGEGRSVGE